MHKFLFCNKFIIFLYMFQALLCSSSGGQIVLYRIWYRHTLYVADRWAGQPEHRSATYRVWRYQMLYITIRPPDDEHNSAWNM